MLASSAGAGWVGWITRQDQPRFEKLIAWATRLRNSVTVELVFILATSWVFWLWIQTAELSVFSWKASNSGSMVMVRPDHPSSMNTTHSPPPHPLTPPSNTHHQL